MKFWLLRKREDLPYDDNPWGPVWWKRSKLPVAGFIILAEAEADARRIADRGAGHENYGENHPWLEPKYSSCTELSTVGPEGIILKDYMEG